MILPLVIGFVLGLLTAGALVWAVIATDPPPPEHWTTFETDPE
jgi:hypothetical protein